MIYRQLRLLRDFLSAHKVQQKKVMQRKKYTQ